MAGRIYKVGPLSYAQGHSKNAKGWRIWGRLPDGRTIDTTRATRDKARDHAERLVEASSTGVNGDVTVGELKQAWWHAGISDTDGPPWEQATQDQYETYSAHLDIWDRRPLATVTTDDVRQLLATITGPGARTSAFKVWRAMFNWGVDNRRLAWSPMTPMSEPAAVRPRSEAGEDARRIPKAAIPGDTDIAEFLPFLPDQIRLAGEIAAECGLRTGEIFGLRVGKVAERMLLIDEQWTGQRFKLPKYNIVRQVPLTATFALRLHDHIAGRDPEELVFPTSVGTPYSRSNWNRSWNDSVKAAGGRWVTPTGGANWTVTNMRHRFATRALTSVAQGGWGLDVARVSLMLGHAKIQTTLEYYVGHVDGVIEGIIDHLDTLD